MGAIYEAPYDEARWNQMAQDIRTTLGCRALLVSAVDAKNQSLSSTAWYGPHDSRFARGVEEYAAEYYQIDPTIAYAATFPSAKFCDVADLMSAEQYSGDLFMPWYRDRFQSDTFVVGYTPPCDGLTLGISLHPGFGNGSLDRDLFRLLFEHVARSVAIAARPPSFESECDAIVLVRSSGRVVALSPQAERYLASNDGLRLENGHLCALTSADTLGIARAIQAACSPAETGSAGTLLFVARPSHMRDWLLSVTPHNTPTTLASAFQATVMVKIVDPSRKHSLSEAVCSRFQFTNREREIADLLLNGHSPSSAARCLSISENTIKVHLQALYRKTQTNRLVDFIGLLGAIS